MYTPTIQDHQLVERSWKWLIISAVLLLGIILAPSTHIPLTIQEGPPIQLNQLNLSLPFVPNKGQTDASVQFQAHDMGSTLFFTANEVILTFPSAGQSQQSAIHLQFVGANSDAVVRGLAQQPGTVNYILGNDPAHWQTDLPAFQGIVYESLYPGINLSYDGVNGRLKGTYIVAPGANPSLIRWQHQGASSVSVNDAGNLIVTLPDSSNGSLVEQAPVVWQEIDGQRTAVPARYSVAADNSVGFQIGTYNQAYPLIIDPTLVYATTLGGSGFEHADDIALDGDGNVYITGLTSSTDFPTETPYQTNQPGLDIFVAKINSTGDGLVYSTYIGGSDDDEGNGLAVNGDGVVYVTGATASDDFPTVNPLQADNNGLDDAFILALNASGNGLLYSTYLGGDSVDNAEAIALDDSDNAYVTGMTSSADFPTVSPYDSSRDGVSDAFVTKINSDGTAWVFSTLLGGSHIDVGSDIAVDATGTYVLGNTFSDDFPTQTAYQSQNNGSNDMFITKLNGGGNGLLYSTYLGGADDDFAYGLAVSNGQAYIAGNTESTDFPTAAPLQVNHAGGTSDAVAAVLGSAGNTLPFSSYLGGSGDDKGYDVAVDATGHIYLTGDTFSSNFPTENPLQANNNGNADAFVAKFDSSALIYSSYLGGTGSDNGYALAIDGTGNAYVVGVTNSSNFPLAGSLNGVFNGESDAFIVKINDEGSGTVPPITGPNLEGSSKTASRSHLWPGEELTFTIRLHNSGTEEATANVEDAIPDGLEYVNLSASGNGTHNAGVVSWENVVVPSGEDVLLTFNVTTSVTELVVAVNTAVITPVGETPIERSTVVLLLPGPIDIDITPPAVTNVVIDDQDVLKSRGVTLHIQASDDTGVEKMFILEWQLVTKPFPHWEEVQNSGWIPYAPQHPWTLGEQSGTHFVAVWVADEAGNISPLTMHGMDFASLLLPGTTVATGDAVPYMVYYGANEAVTARLTPSAGDPDLYVWYPGNFGLPDQKSVEPGLAEDEVSFVTPNAGIYLFLVHGYEAATYELNIVPGGGPEVSSLIGSVEQLGQLAGTTATKPGELTYEPIISQSGVDPMGIVSTPVGPFTTYLPMVVNRP